MGNINSSGNEPSKTMYFCFIRHENWAKFVDEPKNYTIPSTEFEFGMNYPRYFFEKKFANNATLMAILQEPVSSVWDKQAKVRLKEHIAFLDEEVEDRFMATTGVSGVVSESTQEEIKEFVANSINEQMDYIALIMERAVTEEWNKVKKQNKIGNTYKIVTSLKATAKVASVSLSVASLILSGGANIIAYVSIARNISSTIDMIKSGTTKIEKIGTEIEEGIKNMKEAMDTKKVSYAAEVLADMTLSALLGADYFDTQNTLRKKIYNYRSRIALLRQKHISLGKDINKTIQSIEKIPEESDLKSKVAGLEAALQELLKKTSDMGARFKKNEENIITLSEDFKAATSAKAAVAIRIMDTAAKVAFIAGKVVTGEALTDAPSGGAALGAKIEEWITEVT